MHTGKGYPSGMPNSMQQLDARWTFHFPGVTSDRRGPKTRCPKGAASRLVGFDGSDTGGLRPFPGFRRVRTLAPDAASTVGSNHDHTSRVLDMMPFDVRQGTSKSVFGVVYRVRRKTPGSTSDVLLEWYSAGETSPAWHVVEVMTNVPNTGRMSVVPWGKVLYVFLEGQDPKAFYVTGTGTLTSAVVGAGPGTQGTSTFAVTGSSPGSGAVTLPPGDYGFAYELRDSRTGRRSGLSAVSNIVESDFSGSAKYVSASVSVDTAKWDRLYVWRSVRTDDAGGTFSAGLFLLDNIVENPTSTQTAFAKLKDLALSIQDPYLSKQAFDEKVPKGGAAGLVDGCMAVSAIAGMGAGSASGPTQGDEVANVGEIRWSSPSEQAPELFSPLSRWTPSLPNSFPERFLRLGPTLVGLGPDRLYSLRKSNALMRVDEIHEGYGAAGPKASAVMSGVLYWVGPRGLQSMAADGSLDDIAALDDIIGNDWAGLARGVQMGADPAMGALFALEPSTGHAAVLWMRQQTLTELEDLPFTHCATGAWPSDPSDLATNLERRAIFCADFPEAETPPSGWMPSLYVADWSRVRDTTTASGAPDNVRVSTHDATGDLSFVTDADFSGGDYAGGTLTVVNASRVMPSGVVGGRLVVVDVPAVNGSRDESFVGRGAVILAVGASTFTLGTGKTLLQGLPEGSKVSVCPITMRWEGAPLGAGDAEDGRAEAGFHRVRQMSGLAPMATDVGGPASGHAVWCASAWIGNASEPSARAVARDRNGEASEVEDGVGVGMSFSASTTGPRTGYRGNAVAPGWECWCSDLDFRLVGVRVVGRIEGTERS